MDIIYRDIRYADTSSQCLKFFKANPDIWTFSCLTRHINAKKRVFSETENSPLNILFRSIWAWWSVHHEFFLTKCRIVFVTIMCLPTPSFILYTSTSQLAVFKTYGMLQLYWITDNRLFCFHLSVWSCIRTNCWISQEASSILRSWPQKSAARVYCCHF